MCLLGLWNVAYPDIGVITVHDVPPEAEPGHGQTGKNNKEGGQSKVPVKKNWIMERKRPISTSSFQ